jgi:prevent-host-death family protein
MTMVSLMEIQVSKSQFKAKALELFREVESTGGTMIITDHGKPTIEVRPYRKADRNPLEILQGSVTEYQDPVEPVGEGDWEALG